MKFRLIQDSHTKQYQIQRWTYPTVGPWPPIPDAGNWYCYSDPGMYFPGDKGYIPSFYKENERERAVANFNELVARYSSQPIVIKEVDTNTL